MKYSQQTELSLQVNNTAETWRPARGTSDDMLGDGAVPGEPDTRVIQTPSRLSPGGPDNERLKVFDVLLSPARHRP